MKKTNFYEFRNKVFILDLLKRESLSSKQIYEKLKVEDPDLSYNNVRMAVFQLKNQGVIRDKSLYGKKVYEITEKGKLPYYINIKPNIKPVSKLSKNLKKQKNKMESYPINGISCRQLIFQYLDNHPKILSMSKRGSNSMLYNAFPQLNKVLIRTYKQQYKNIFEEEQKNCSMQSTTIYPMNHISENYTKNTLYIKKLFALFNVQQDLTFKEANNKIGISKAHFYRIKKKWLLIKEGATEKKGISTIRGYLTKNPFALTEELCLQFPLYSRSSISRIRRSFRKNLLQDHMEVLTNNE